MALSTAERNVFQFIVMTFLVCAALIGGARSVAAQSPAQKAGDLCTTTCFVDAAAGDDANSGATPATALRTIQAAVERVQPGGEVRVAPGVYTEQVMITKSLHLLGDKAADTWLLAPDDMPPAEALDSAIVTIAGAGVEVEVAGLTVAGPGANLCGSIGAGIFVHSGADAHIHGNAIREIRDKTLSDCPYGVAIQVGRASLAITGTATISNNTIVDYQKNGITVSGVGSKALIEQNDIIGAGPTAVIAQNGVQVSDGASATLNNNTIRGHSYTPLVATATGLLVMNADADTAGNTFIENQVSIYHIDGSGVHDGNRVRTTSAGVRSYAFWGIVADDPPPGRLPSPIDPPPTGAMQDVESSVVGAATTNTMTIRVINNELESDGSIGGFAIEADGGYGRLDVDFTASNNIVRNWHHGITVFQCRNQPYCTDAGFVNVSVQLNSITGNRIGLYSNADEVEVNGVLNWWGSATGPNTPGADPIVGTVASTPWLCNGDDLDAAVGFQPNTQAICDGLGDLTVAHRIDWSGVPPVEDQRFTLCVSGPAFSSPNCQETVDGSVTWSNIPVGDYAVTMSEPGPEWFVTLPDIVAVGDTTPAQTVVTSTLRAGTLTVQKIVNWQGAPSADNIDFEICVSGPSYPSDLCEQTSGGVLVFGPLAPGVYTVRETPQEGWRATIEPPTVTIAPSETGRVTVENRYVGPMLACPLLDNFNRANTVSGLGNDWAGVTSNYRITNNQGEASSVAGPVFWSRPSPIFGSDQVVCLRLASINQSGRHFALMLKAQNMDDYNNGLILVNYDALNEEVTVETVEPGQDGWAVRMAIAETFAEGDVLGARASANGWVYTYRNGVMIGAVSTSRFFINRGGRIGIWAFQSGGARFDDFGGGNTPASMVNAAGDMVLGSQEEQSVNVYLPTIQR